ncbi:MAG: MBG domain-containing protein, partial [Marinoscillum sp.]
QVRTYGAENPELTYSYDGFVNGEGATDLESEPEVTTTATEASTVGSYSITSSGGSATNYEFDFTEGTLTVEKAPLSVLADDKVRVYGTANPELTYSYEGFVNGEGATDLESEPEITTIATEASAVGSYSITSSGGSAINYVFEHTNGTLTVEKAPLSLLVDDQVRTYGATNPELTYSYDGFVNSEGATDLEAEPEVTTTATEASTVGSYPITSSGGSATNYAFEYAEGALVIEKALLSVLVDDQTIVYGDAQPTYTWSYSGFVNEEQEGVIDVLPEIVDMGDVKDAGAYVIQVAGGMDDNYMFTFNSGLLVVSKAELQAVIQDVMILQGDAIPAFTVTFQGFKYDDDQTALDVIPSASVDLTDTDTPGTYSIMLAGGLDNNYEFDLQDGVLTIGQILRTQIGDNSLIYPNPTDQFIYVVPGKAKSVEVYNLQGLLVLRSLVTQQIDVSGLSSGIYVIYLKDENRKIISHHKLSKN